MNNKMAIHYLSITEPKNQNKQISRTETDSYTENILKVARWEGKQGRYEKGEWIESTNRQLVTEQSWGYK